MSDRATAHCRPPRIRVTLTINHHSVDDAAPMVRARAGEREIAAKAIAESGEWAFEVPSDALLARVEQSRLRPIRYLSLRAGRAPTGDDLDWVFATGL
jgi:hypothetical protein